MPGHSHTINLPPECDLQWASSFHESLMREGASRKHFSFEAADVIRIGTPAIQLLLAVARATGEHGGHVSVRGASDAFSRAFADLGLASLLTQWSMNSDE